MKNGSGENSKYLGTVFCKQKGEIRKRAVQRQIVIGTLGSLNSGLGVWVGKEDLEKYTSQKQEHGVKHKENSAVELRSLECVGVGKTRGWNEDSKYAFMK